MYTKVHTFIHTCVYVCPVILNQSKLRNNISALTYAIQYWLVYEIHKLVLQTHSTTKYWYTSALLRCMHHDGERFSICVISIMCYNIGRPTKLSFSLCWE